MRAFGNENERAERREEFQRLWSRFSSNRLTIIGALIVTSVIVSAIFAPVLAPYPEHAGPSFNNEDRFLAPSIDHPFGTDANGRDIFSRVLFGARIALQMATIVLSISITVGVVLGLVAGFIGGWANILIMRLVDVFLSIPAILLAMVVASILEPDLYITMFAISLRWWTYFARLVQGEVI
jgi:peptide/nickel transport system permease protein